MHTLSAYTISTLDYSKRLSNIQHSSVHSKFCYPASDCPEWSANQNCPEECAPSIHQHSPIFRHTVPPSCLSSQAQNSLTIMRRLKAVLPADSIH